MFLAAALAVLVAMALALVRALAGPTVYDRILAVNMFGTKTVLMLAIIGYITDRPEFTDISLAYALINFVGTVAVMRFFKAQDPASRPHTRGLGD